MSIPPLSRRWAVFLVALVAVAVYANSLANGFAYDDVPIIPDNARVHSLSLLGQIWLKPYWPSYGMQLGLYRPLTLTLFALQWTVSGGAPWLFHAVNVAAHAAVSVLVLLFLARFVALGPALLGALVFAVHPLHTEAVANVVGQAEIWAALGVLAALVLYTARPDGAGTSAGRRAAIAVPFALAVLAKESAIVLPALLVLVDFVQGRVRPSRRELAAYARAAAPVLLLLGGVAVAYLLLRVAALGVVAGTDVAPAYPFLQHDHVRIGLRAWVEYVRLFFFPQDLSADYSPAVILPFQGMTPMALVGTGIFLGVVALAALTPWRPRLGFAAAWCLITILVVSNLFFAVGVFVAERTLYLPSMAVSILAAYAWAAVPAAGRGRALSFAAAALALLLLGARTIVRNPDWRNMTSVAAALLRDHPESYRAQWLGAVRAGLAGDGQRAALHWELGLRLWPNDAHYLLEMSDFMLRNGQSARSLELVSRAERLRSGHPLMESVLAAALIENGRYEEALPHIDSASGKTGPTAATLALRARAYHGLRRYPLALGAWRAALRTRRGSNWLNWAGAAVTLAVMGDTVAARTAFDSASALVDAPNAARLRTMRARTLAPATKRR